MSGKITLSFGTISETDFLQPRFVLSCPTTMYAAGPKNPLHGITLQMMLTQLVDHYGWEMLGQMIKINCFNFHPSIKSSLTFLRRTDWARKKVEELYLDSLPDMQRKPEAEVEAEPAQPGEDQGPADTAPSNP